VTVPNELDDRLDRRLKEKKVRDAMAAMGLRTVGDLLRRPPRRYVYLSVLTNLDELPVGEEVTVVAQVVKVATHKMKNRPGSLTEVVVADEEGRQLYLTFFNQPWREKVLRPGYRAAFSGKVGSYKGKRQLTHPAVELVDDEPAEGDTGVPAVDAEASYLIPIPIYDLARELRQGASRKAIWGLLDTLGPVLDPVPSEVLHRHHLLGLRDALEAVHRPRTAEHAEEGRYRLVWEEAFVLQTELARRRAEANALPAVPRRAAQDGVAARFEQLLPFELTAGQREIGAVLASELAREHPMHRLLQGEVGTGKTVVALRAMLAVVDSGGQSALLAPTEVLAQQHYRSLTRMLGPLAERGRLGGSDVGTTVTLLTGSMGTAARRRALLDAQSGDAGIVVGTHALLQEQVGFADLGLVVVDEQHRFGVEQRNLLRAKAARPPHLLVMTATPIPRTIAMTVFGDLDVSTLTEQPPGRAGVMTHVVPVADKPHYLERAWQRVREEVAAGHQAFVVCPQITLTEKEPADAAEADEVTAAPATAVLDLAPQLAAGPLAGVRVEVLHGRMPAEDKDDVMQRFGAGQVDVLVATTVVEVGVDVPNATAMVIMDAHRFGVSQLHQLRGRIGRGSAPGICLLVTDVPEGTVGRERVEAVAATNDGFELAEVDLAQRREGDVLGTSQAGSRSSLRLLRVTEHEPIILEAREEALALVDADPTLADHPALAEALEALVERDRAEFLERG
jgi:ATP-dependent DNA helicase RecG